MRFGVREICDVVFKALTSTDIGDQHFDAGQPVLYIDTAKTASLEGAATTVYAQGGKGNPRLIGWEGEKTLTFTIEDALMSPISFHMLSGAGVIKGRNADEDGKGGKKIYVHTTYDLVAEANGDKVVAVLSAEARDNATLVVSKEAPVYPVVLDAAGAVSNYLTAVTENEILVDDKAADSLNGEIQADNKDITFVLGLSDSETTDSRANLVKAGDAVRIDCYTVYTEGATQLEIEAGTFAGYYYIEASTLFRDEATGVDMPAEFVIPRGKIQSNFTFTMASSGDPSTFTFTVDAFPAYTKFDKSKKVMAALQIIDTKSTGHPYSQTEVVGHPGRAEDEDVEKWYTNSIFTSTSSQVEETENQG